MITKVVKVDLHQPIYEKLTAKQGDIASRFILFHLLDGDTPLDLTEKSVRVYARKPDNTEIFNDLIINDRAKGYCTLELTSQCLASAGTVKMELYISESDKVLTSIPFELKVINSINSADSIVSTNEFSALNEALGSLQDYNNLRSEIIQARKGHATVGERLDNFDSQLEHIAISPLKFNIIGDSITDDTENINKMLAYYGDKPKKITFSGTYKISNKINIPSNTVIDFNNSKFIWENTENVINPNGATWWGMFNIEGVETETVANITGVTTQYNRSKLMLDDGTKFNIGDFVKIDIYNVTVPQTKNSYYPSFRMMCEVTNVGDDYIIVDVNNPFDFSGYDFTGCTVTKINPVENVEIYNFNVENITLASDISNNNRLATGISAIYSNNVVIKNVYGNKVQLPLVFGYYAKNTIVENVKNLNPTHVGSGQGYAVKFARSCYGSVKNLYGVMNRHVIDFSGACYYDVDTIYSPKSQGMDISLHGMCEHDITFNNTRGVLTSGSGFHSFSMLMKNIKVNNHTGALSIYNIDGLNVNDSDIIFNGKSYDDDTIQNVNISNSNILVNTSGDTVFDGTKRKEDLTTSFKLNNCKLKTNNNKIRIEIIASLLDLFELNNCDVDFKGIKGFITQDNTTEFNIFKTRLNGSLINFKVDNGNVINCNLDNYTHNILVSDTINNSISDVYYRNVYNFDNATNGTINLNINNSDINISASSSPYQPFNLFKSDTVNDNVNCNIKLKNSFVDTARQDTSLRIRMLENKANFIVNVFNTFLTSKVGNLDNLFKYAKCNNSYTEDRTVTNLEIDTSYTLLRPTYYPTVESLPTPEKKGVIVYVGGNVNKYYGWNGNEWKSIVWE